MNRPPGAHNKALTCPTCRGLLDPMEHQGIVINRRASLRAQLLTLQATAERVRPIAASMRKDSEAARLTLASATASIETITSELAWLDLL